MDRRTIKKGGPMKKGINKLLIAIGCFIMAIFCLFLMFGCSTALRANCVDSSILAAETYKDAGYEVRLIYGMGRKLPHIQAQAFIDGKWECLVVDMIHTGWQDVFTITQIMTIEQARAYWRKK